MSILYNLKKTNMSTLYNSKKTKYEHTKYSNEKWVVLVHNKYYSENEYERTKQKDIVTPEFGVR